MRKKTKEADIKEKHYYRTLTRFVFPAAIITSFGRKSYNYVFKMIKKKKIILTLIL